MGGLIGLIYTLNLKEFESNDGEDIHPDKDKLAGPEVLSSVVEDRSRKYATSWPTGHGGHLQDTGLIPDMMELTANSMNTEWVEIFTQRVYELADSTTINLNKSALSVDDWLSPLIAAINLAAHKIHTDTDRDQRGNETKYRYHYCHVINVEFPGDNKPNCYKKQRKIKKPACGLFYWCFTY